VTPAPRRRVADNRGALATFLDTTIGKVIAGPVLVLFFMGTGAWIFTHVTENEVTNSAQSQALVDQDHMRGFITDQRNIEMADRKQDVRELRGEMDSNAAQLRQEMQSIRNEPCTR
jgi:hypothetical protein